MPARAGRREGSIAIAMKGLIMERRKLFIIWTLLALTFAACSSNAATTQPDQVATQVAVARAVAATLTADAPATVPPSGTATLDLSGATQPANTATSEPPATVPPEPSSTPRPTRTAPRPPTPTNTPIVEAADPFVPNVGNAKGLNGKVVLPGYSGPLDPPVFRDHIVFKLVVFDPAFGKVDGAGIKRVDIKATDPLGRTVIDRQEGSWAYCPFGNAQNSPDCTIWRFSEHNFAWPNGTPVCAGQGYSVNMVVETEDHKKNGANWQLDFAIESPDGSLPSCQ